MTNKKQDFFSNSENPHEVKAYRKIHSINSNKKVFSNNLIILEKKDRYNIYFVEDILVIKNFIVSII